MKSVKLAFIIMLMLATTVSAMELDRHYAQFLADLAQMQKQQESAHRKIFFSRRIAYGI